MTWSERLLIGELSIIVLGGGGYLVSVALSRFFNPWVGRRRRPSRFRP